MVAKLYIVSIRWVATALTVPNVEAIDRALGPYGDWLRYSGTTWLSFTEFSASALRESVRLNLKDEDNLLIIRGEPSDYEGWSQPWVWKWIQDKIPSASNNPLKAGLGSLTPPGTFNPLIGR